MTAHNLDGFGTEYLYKEAWARVDRAQAEIVRASRKASVTMDPKDLDAVDAAWKAYEKAVRIARGN